MSAGKLIKKQVSIFAPKYEFRSTLIFAFLHFASTQEIKIFSPGGIFYIRLAKINGSSLLLFLRKTRFSIQGQVSKNWLISCTGTG